MAAQVQSIMTAMRMAGQGTEGAARALASDTPSRDADLYDALAELLQRSSEKTWGRYSRRMLSMRAIMPGNERDELPPLVVVIDTSGSIDDRILSAFVGKIKRLAAEYRPENITVIWCDDRVHGTPETHDADSIQDAPLRPLGGGGTDLRPPFKWVADNMPCAPAALVYLTDLDGTLPQDDPGYPVIWAEMPCWRKPARPAFGQVVAVGVE